MREKIETTKKITEVVVSCDLCKEKTGYCHNEISYYDPGEWPEDESISYQADICDDCFLEKIYPILKENGVLLKDPDGDELEN